MRVLTKNEKYAKIVEHMINIAMDDKSAVTILENNVVQIIYKNTTIRFNFFDRQLTDLPDYVIFTLRDERTKTVKVCRTWKTPEFYQEIDTYYSLKKFWEATIYENSPDEIDLFLKDLQIY